MNLRNMVYQLRQEMSQSDHTLHPCDCGRGQCRSVKCWQCWRSDLQKAVGVINAQWLVRKIRVAMDTETDIQHFIKSQEEAKEGGHDG